MMMQFRLAVLAIVTASLFACSRSQRASGALEPASSTGSLPTVSSSNSGPWTITPISQEESYRSTASTLLELADSAGITRDSMKSTVDFTLSINRSNEALSYSTTIESLSVEGGERTGSIPAGIHLPFSFTGHFQHGKLTVESKAQSAVTDCSNEALSTMTTVQRTLVPTPLVLRKDMTWMDSTTASTCSGSIPVNNATSRHYRVMGATSRGILVEQQVKSISSGEGTQGQHRVRLYSEDSGTTELTINPQTGALVESTGTHIASVVVTASGRDRKFTQTTRERISQR